MHKAYVIKSNGNSVFVNASTVNGSENSLNTPIISDLKLKSILSHIIFKCLFLQEPNVIKWI